MENENTKKKYLINDIIDFINETTSQKEKNK